MTTRNWGEITQERKTDSDYEARMAEARAELAAEAEAYSGRWRTCGALAI